jgi:hypothetical protein
MDIAVQLLGVTAFRFVMQCDEDWADGQLVALRTRADDDGKKRSVDLRQGDGSQPQLLRVSYNGRASTVPAGVMPTSLWNPDTVAQTELVDVLNGKTRNVIVTQRGAETLQIGGRPIQAQHYAIRGDIERDIWYAPDGQLLKVTFAAKDGSQVVVLRKSL